MIRRTALTCLTVFSLLALALAQQPAHPTEALNSKLQHPQTEKSPSDLQGIPNLPLPVALPPLPPLTVPLSSLTDEELDHRAEQLRMRKNYLSALDCYEIILKRKPTAAIYNKTGMTYIALMEPGKAEKYLKKAIKLNKTFSEAHNNLGVTYYMRRKFRPAVKEYRKAIKLNPENASFHSNLGTAYVEKKEYHKGLAEYQTAFQLDPEIFDRTSQSGISARMSSPADRARFCYMMAKLYASNGDFNRALTSLRRAMEDGYKDIDKVYTDAEFAKLREDARFTELMKSPPKAIPQ